jgi:exosortase
MTKVAWPRAGLVLILAATLAAGWRPLVDTVGLSLHRDEYTYILLVIPISVALLIRESRSLETMAAPSVRTGSSILAVACLIALAARGWSARLSPDMFLAICMFALVISWIGAFVLCLGSAASRSTMFPLLLLFGVVPAPEMALNAAVALLQEGSAWTAHLLLSASGIIVIQDGILLKTPGVTLVVGPECSSIRSSSMLLVVASVAAQLLLCSPWRKALVIALAVPLSVAKNGFRIYTIATLGTRVDRGYLTGSLHHHGGIVFFLAALAVIFALVSILRREGTVLSVTSSRRSKARTNQDVHPGTNAVNLIGK